MLGPRELTNLTNLHCPLRYNDRYVQYSTTNVVQRAAKGTRRARNTRNPYLSTL